MLKSFPNFGSRHLVPWEQAFGALRHSHEEAGVKRQMPMTAFNFGETFDSATFPCLDRMTECPSSLFRSRRPGFRMWPAEEKGPLSHEFVKLVVTQLLGIQFCMGSLGDFDYMFTKEFVRDGETRASDTQHIAEVLLLPYWFWGAACGLFSVVVLAGGLVTFWRATAEA